MSPSITTIIVSVAAIHWFVFESIWTKSRIKDGYRVFSASWGLKILFFVGIPFFLYGAIVNFFENPHERWVSIILLTFAILGVLFVPTTILLSRERVVSVRWFGLRRIELNWNDVDAIYSDPEKRSIIIEDKNQRRIVHTMLNVNHEGFLDELRLLSTAVSKKITFSCDRRAARVRDPME